MTIKQRGKDKICSAEFYVEKKPYRFSFNGKKGMPLITTKKEAREKESELKRQIKAGTFFEDSPLKNFAKFHKEIFMDYSRENKSELAVKFDEYYGAILVAEFGRYDLGQITPRMVEKFLLKLSKTKTKYGRAFSPVTVRMIYDRLNQLFHLAVRERVFTDNPVQVSQPLCAERFS